MLNLDVRFGGCDEGEGFGVGARMELRAEDRVVILEIVEGSLETLNVGVF